MRNYLEEIRELENEVMELTKRIDILRVRKMSLFNLYLDASNISSPIRYSEVKVIFNRYHEVSMCVDELDAKRYEIKKRIDELRKEYRELHTREFYIPMDEIDIADLIQRDGFIIAVKF